MEYLANSAESTLAGGITNIATSLSVASGEGARFPASGNFRCILTDGTNSEFVTVTARAADTFTIVRESEDSSRFPKRAWSTGAIVAAVMTAGAMDALRSDWLPLSLCGGRLTLESGVPVSNTDQTGKTTLYWSPKGYGGRVALYDGTLWRPYQVPEISVALGTLVSGKIYDVFMYPNSGSPALELGTAWTNDTTPSITPTLQDNIYVKAGDPTRRYLGSFRTTSTTTTEDSAAKRFLYNAYNQEERDLRWLYAAASHTYASTTWRQMGGLSSSQVELLVGWGARSFVSLELKATMSDASGGAPDLVIARDQTSGPNSTNLAVGGRIFQSGVTNSAHLDERPPIGYHYYAALERVAGGAVTVSVFGSTGETPAIYRTGMTGKVWC